MKAKLREIINAIHYLIKGISYVGMVMALAIGWIHLVKLLIEQVWEQWIMTAIIWVLFITLFYTIFRIWFWLFEVKFGEKKNESINSPS